MRGSERAVAAAAFQIKHEIKRDQNTGTVHTFLRLFRSQHPDAEPVRVCRAGLTNVGALFGKMCGAPLPPYTVESRIESKNARPIIFWGFYVFNFIMKYR